MSDAMRFLEERDVAQLVEARKADAVLRPITRFARGHMSHTQTLLSMWPDLEAGDERVAAVERWYKDLQPRIERVLDDSFAGERSPEVRSEMIAANFREAISQAMACNASQQTPEAKLMRRRFQSRAIEIAEVLASKVDTSLKLDDLQRGMVIIIVWGEHGAHFPDT